MENSDTDTLTYEAEVLPEIEIREIVSFEELAASDAKFIAFTEDELRHHLSQLLQDKYRGNVFYDLYFALRNALEHPSSEYAIPVLKTQVRSMENDEDLLATLKSLDDTNQAPNYVAQMEEIYKLTYPLEVDGEPKQHTYIPMVPTLVTLESGLSKRFVLLPRDKVPQELAGFAYRVPNVTKSSYIHERAGVHTIPELPTEFNKDTAQPSFEYVCNAITELGDLHSLKVHLEKYGYDLHRLNDAQCATLIDRLQSIPVSEDKDNDETKTTLAAWKLKPSDREHMWKVYEQVLQHTQLEREKYQALADSLLSSTQLITPTVDIPNDIHEIAQAIRTNRLTLEDVIANLKYQRTFSQFNALRDMLQDFQSYTLDEVKEALQAVSEKWKHVFMPYVDRITSEFVDSYRDMSEIKEGNDDSSYLGDRQAWVFEEQQNQPMNSVDVDLDDEEDDVVDDLQQPSIDLSALSDGCREVVLDIMPKLVKMQSVSGLVLNFVDLVTYLKTAIVRTSRNEYIMQNIPSLSPHIRNQLLQMDMTRAMDVAKNITSKEISEQLKNVWRAWEDDVKQTFIESLVWWSMDTQQKALMRELQFDSMKGSVVYLSKWSPLGPPLQTDKGEGVVIYLSHIAADIGAWGWSAEDIKRFVLDSLQNHPRFEELQTMYIEHGKNVVTMTEKAKAANLSLAEAIENKQKNRYIPEFVKTYMQLPGLLSSASSSSRHAFGCCLQKVGREFKADSDWRGKLKNLRDVKAAFGKQRMTMAEMPQMAVLVRQRDEDDVQQTIGYTNTSQTVEIEKVGMGNISTWLEMWASLNATVITHDQIQSVYTDNSGASKAESYIKKALKTAAVKLDLAAFIDSAPWTQLEHVLVILSTNLHRMQQKYEQDSREAAILREHVRESIHIRKHMHKLHGIFDEVDFSKIRPMYKYVISKMLCLPAAPETSKNDILIMGEAVSADFVKKTIKTALDQIRSYIKGTQMLSSKEQSDFITEMREQQKINTLKILDDKTVDDRQLLLDMKRIQLYSFNLPQNGQNADDDKKDEEDDTAITYKGADDDDDAQSDGDTLDDV